ncbi:uncharacterized protein [Tenebrio molitor]|uniref:uncharacterized protein n=1 Tax=Tenebrio molitor TaxID=7067 RepID=UPI0036248006
MIFFVSNAIYLAVSVYTVSVWTRALGVRFVNTYVFELLPVYSQFFITVSICVILKMIQSRYGYQKVLLIRHFTQAPKQLSHLTLLKVKRSLLVLKDAVDLFNDIFGWNILLSIFFGAVRSLIYIETTVRREENAGGHDVSENYWQVAARVSYAFFYWFGIFAVILWCDAVREEFEGLLSYCYQIQECVSGSMLNENEFYAFTNSVSQNMPEFTAARYFCIDSFYTLIVAGLTKRRQWFLLVRHLGRVECEINNAKSLYMIFFVSNAIYLAVSVYTISVWTRALGVRFVNTYVFELLPVYSQFFITVSICVILKMIQSRYKHQKILLIRHFTQARKQLSYLILLKIKRSLLVLKDAVDLFNDIFGWNILLSIFFGALRSLIYIETTIRREDNVGGHDVAENYWQAAARVSYAFFYWFGIFAVILWCDAVREEFEGLLSYCYQIQECVSGSMLNENEFYAFTNIVSQNMPQFTAARYFYIDRSAIFSILNSVTTFILVMIQFSSI